MQEQRNTVKLSGLIVDALCQLAYQRLRQIHGDFEGISIKCSGLEKDSRLLYAALEKGWLTAAQNIISGVSRNLTDFCYSLQKFKELISQEQPAVPRLADIFAELGQMVQEFGEYHFDLKEKTISVITEPITLEDVALGPFEIKLFIDRMSKLPGGSPYRVIALDPNPAGPESQVTHPHVSSDVLCEGNGCVAIRRALEQGRLCDFFRLVESVLQTYYAAGAYVSLEDWEGIGCYDCGSTIGSDDRYYCDYCNQDFCDQCSSYCHKCDTTICFGCACQCPSCGEPVCGQCAAPCRVCGETYCIDCLSEEGICQTCEEQRKEDSDEEHDETTEQQKTRAPVQPDGVGETVALPRHDG